MHNFKQWLSNITFGTCKMTCYWCADITPHQNKLQCPFFNSTHDYRSNNALRDLQCYENHKKATNDWQSMQILQMNMKGHSWINRRPWLRSHAVTPPWFRSHAVTPEVWHRSCGRWHWPLNHIIVIPMSDSSCGGVVVVTHCNHCQTSAIPLRLIAELWAVNHQRQACKSTSQDQRMINHRLRWADISGRVVHPSKAAEIWLVF